MESTDPLDILLPSAGDLLKKTEQLLEGRGIKHSRLTLMADVSQNVAISDSSSVFVKVYRRRDGLEEPRNTRIAQSYGAPTTELLAATDWCSVWKYEMIEEFPHSRLDEVLPLIRRVHEGTAGLDLIEAISYPEALEVVLGRLKKLGPSPLGSLVGELCREVCDDLERLTADRPLVFAHSDLQFRNMGLSAGRPIVLDWEICKMAPVELELSKIEENLFTEGEWEAGLVSRLYGGPVDEEILYHATVLRYTQNLAFFLERDEFGVAERQVEALFAYRGRHRE